MQTFHSSPRSHPDPQARERRRRAAAKLFAKGRSQADVARHFAVSREAVRKWYDAWSREGVTGLHARPKPGRPVELTPLKQQRVAAALLKGPTAFGYTTEVWTLKRIGAVIKQVARVSYHPGHVWRVLGAMGWSCQKPETRARERNEAAIQTWVRRTWPRIKKGGGKITQPSAF